VLTKISYNVGFLKVNDSKIFADVRFRKQKQLHDPFLYASTHDNMRTVSAIDGCESRESFTGTFDCNENFVLLLCGIGCDIFSYLIIKKWYVITEIVLWIFLKIPPLQIHSKEREN